MWGPRPPSRTGPAPRRRAPSITVPRPPGPAPSAPRQEAPPRPSRGAAPAGRAGRTRGPAPLARPEGWAGAAVPGLPRCRRPPVVSAGHGPGPGPRSPRRRSPRPGPTPPSPPAPRVFTDPPESLGARRGERGGPAWGSGPVRGWAGQGSRGSPLRVKRCISLLPCSFLLAFKPYFSRSVGGGSLPSMPFISLSFIFIYFIFYPTPASPPQPCRGADVELERNDSQKEFL